MVKSDYLKHILNQYPLFARLARLFASPILFGSIFKFLLKSADWKKGKQNSVFYFVDGKSCFILL